MTPGLGARLNTAKLGCEPPSPFKPGRRGIAGIDRLFGSRLRRRLTGAHQQQDKAHHQCSCKHMHPTRAQATQVAA